MISGAPMHVAHVIPSMSTSSGGPPFVVAGLTEALCDLGIRQTVITTDALTPAQAHQARANAQESDFPEMDPRVHVAVARLSHPYRIAYSSSLGTIIESVANDADVIHIHSVNLYPQLAAWRFARRHKLPYVVSPHGALDPWIRKQGQLRKRVNDWLWQRRMLDGAAAIHLTTDEERESIASLKLSAPKIVIPIGVDVRRFAGLAEPGKFRSRWVPGHDGPVIMNHGRLAKKKGLDILVRALPEIRREYHAHLVIVGADEEGIGADLQALAHTLGVSDSLTLVPALGGQELVDAISAADVWCLPSHTENFGLAVFEAMASGRAVVASPGVYTASDAYAAHALEMVANEPEDVSRTIIQLLLDSDRRQCLGARAVTYAKAFSWQSLSEKYVTAYNDAILARQQ